MQQQFSPDEQFRQDLLKEERQRQERIALLRSRFQDKLIVCRLIGPRSQVILQGVVQRVTNDGHVEVRCQPLGFSPFLALTDVDFAFSHFYPVDDEPQKALSAAPTPERAVSR